MYICLKEQNIQILRFVSNLWDNAECVTWKRAVDLVDFMELELSGINSKLRTKLPFPVIWYHWLLLIS